LILTFPDHNTQTAYDTAYSAMLRGPEDEDKVEFSPPKSLLRM
jgi:hypothetical protein